MDGADEGRPCPACRQIAEAHQAEVARVRCNLLALDILDVAASAPTCDAAAAAARQVAPLVLAEASVDEQAEVAAILAVMAVWLMPPAVEPVRSAGAIRFRLAQVGSWLRKRRSDLTCLTYELTWRSS